MAAFIKVAKKSDLEEGRGTIIEQSGSSIALFLIKEKVYAIKNVCPHAKGPLGEGSVDENIVTCPWHGWEFDVTTGKNEGNDKVRVRTYPVKIEAEDIYIEI